MRRMLLTLAVSLAILTVGALVPDRADTNPAGGPQQAIEFVQFT